MKSSSVTSPQRGTKNEEFLLHIQFKVQPIDSKTEATLNIKTKDSAVPIIVSGATVRCKKEGGRKDGFLPKPDVFSATRSRHFNEEGFPHDFYSDLGLSFYGLGHDREDC